MSWFCTLLKITCTSGTLIGPAYVIDGDTISINHEHVRLYGVDAEELAEPNGYAAKAHLILLIRGREVTCRWDGWSHNRKVAVCHAGGINLNYRMIGDGYALDCARYSDGLYRSAEPLGARGRLIQKGYCK